MSDFARKIIKIVGEMPDEGEPEEFVHGTFGLLAAAISKLPDVCEATFWNWINARTP
jgi:hypothetical protein